MRLSDDVGWTEELRGVHANELAFEEGWNADEARNETRCDDAIEKSKQHGIFDTEGSGHVTRRERRESIAGDVGSRELSGRKGVRRSTRWRQAPVQAVATRKALFAVGATQVVRE